MLYNVCSRWHPTYSKRAWSLVANVVLVVGVITACRRTECSGRLPLIGIERIPEVSRFFPALVLVAPSLPAFFAYRYPILDPYFL